MDYTRRIFKGSYLVTIGKASALAITLVSTIFLARILKPFEYGVLNLAITALIVSALFTDFGIGASAVYFTSKGFNQKKLMGLLVKWKIVVIAVVSIALFLLSSPIAIFYKIPQLGFLLKLFSLSLVFYSISFFMQSLLQAYHKFRLFMFTDLTLSITRFVPLAFVAVGFGLNGAAAGFVIAYAASAIVGMFLFYFSTKIDDKGETPKTKDIANYSLFIFWGLLFFNLYNLATNLIIGYFLTAEFVGFFTISWQAGSYAIMLVPTALQTALWPTLSEMHLKKEDINESFRRITKYMVYIAIPAGIGLMILSEGILSTVFGADYIPAAPLLRLISLACILQGCSTSIDGIVLSVGKPKLITFKTAIQAIVNVVLAVILIPRFGIIGAGIAFLSAMIVGVTLINYWALKEYKFRYPFRCLAKSLVAAIVMAFAIQLLINSRLFIVIPLGILVYFGVLILLKGFDRKDVQIMGLEKYLGFLGVSK